MKQRKNLLLLCFLALSASAVGDELIMKNGSQLIGTLVRIEADRVVFDTPFAGELAIKQESIEHIVTADPVNLMMADGTIYRDKKIVSNETDGQVIVTADGGAPVTYGIAEIALINPDPWKLGDGYIWYGEASGALEMERGNSDTDEWDYKGSSTWRSLEDRYVIGGEGELDKSSGDKTSDNWKIKSKYDRFFVEEPEDYYGVKLRFEYDKFQDLDLRTIIGPHIGRQFFEAPLLSLRAEVGPVWVDEQFNVAEDNDYPGALWEVDASSDIIGFGTKLYVIHDGIINFDDTDELVLNATVGLKMPLILGFETAIEAKFEYDGGAVEGVDDTDETYKLRIGYAW